MVEDMLLFTGIKVFNHHSSHYAWETVTIKDVNTQSANCHYRRAEGVWGSGIGFVAHF